MATRSQTLGSVERRNIVPLERVRRRMLWFVERRNIVPLEVVVVTRRRMLETSER